MINVISIEPGARLMLVTGALAEVVENVGDGQWLNIRYVEAEDASIIGEEELCHASDVKSIVEQKG
jgi:hypothetical protein